eukprot:TRINITY_DN7311_c0_g4_i1.p1 TRINITY_DN7311_c0_g4~~TRINITY_DN7311_c0_g4_i1.p1  ORF type:complete len:388 (+),score=51.44 TRINITY_DN7311_c0_g4_i1:69-1166(+)
MLQFFLLPLLPLALQAVAQESNCSVPAEEASLLQARRDSEPRRGWRHGMETWDDHSRFVRDWHALIIRDVSDYRGDAASYLQEVLDGRRGRRGCPLPKMSLREVEGRWRQHVAPAQSEGEVKEARWSFNAALHQNYPVMVGDVMAQLGWPAAHRWSQSQLTQRFRNHKFHEEFFRYHDGWIHGVRDHHGGIAEETLAEYLDSNQSGQGIFLFVSEDGRDTGDYEAATLDTIRSDFLPHPNFAYSPAARQAMLNVDAIGSSHGFHFHNPVWQVQVEGYKMWYFMPPDYPVDTPSHRFGAAPLGADGKPFLHPNACAMLKQVEPPPAAFSCMVAPGEMVLLPHGWFHATCGLSNYTASVGGWMSEGK